MQPVLRNTILGVTAAVFAPFISNVAAEIKDARIGTWSHCVAAKSKADPNPAPGKLTIKFEAAGSGSHTTVNGANSEGAPVAVEYTAQYDGKDYPLKGAPWADTVSLKLVNSQTTIRTDKKDGKVVQTLKGVVSKDGKTFTITQTVTSPEGKPASIVSVCERQS
jgi:hypothetical protein